MPVASRYDDRHSQTITSSQQACIIHGWITQPASGSTSTVRTRFGGDPPGILPEEMSHDQHFNDQVPMGLMLAILESVTPSKRAISGPARYRSTKLARRSSLKMTAPSTKRVKFSEVNTEITFDIGSAPCLLRAPTKADDINLHQYLKCLIEAGSSNIFLKLDLKGSRIDNLQELDNHLNQPDLGLQTHCDKEDTSRVDLMSREQLLDALKYFNGYIDYESLPDQQIRALVQELYDADIRRAIQRREEIISNELIIRDITPTCNLMDNVKLLRKELRREKDLAQQEDAILAEIAKEIETLSRENCFEKLIQLRHTSTSNMLQAVGLGCSGSIIDQERRLDLFLQIRKRVFILSSHIQPQQLSYDKLVEELKERRIQIPFGANENFLRRILANALIGEQEKAPIKFPFGVRALSLEDLEDLPLIMIRAMLVQSQGAEAISDILTNNEHALQARLCETILQQNNHAYVHVIRSVLFELNQLGLIAKLDNEAKSDWTKWFNQLEHCLKTTETQVKQKISIEVF